VLTGVVTPRLEFFRDGPADGELIRALHEVAAWLGEQAGVRAVTFRQVANGEVPIN